MERQTERLQTGKQTVDSRTYGQTEFKIGLCAGHAVETMILLIPMQTK